MFKFIVVTTLFAGAARIGDALPEQSAKKYSIILARNGRLINATDTIIEMVPWQVSLLYNISLIDSYRYFACGGSIISSIWIVTAAHCVFDMDKTELPVNHVSAGSSGMSNGSIHRIVAKICHPSYVFMASSETTVNDIALLRVSNPFVLDSWRKSVPLYVGDAEYLAESVAIASGWGSTRTDGRGLSKNLKTIRMIITSRLICDEFLSKVYNVTIVRPGQICANGLAKGFVCYGDSGGPLTVDKTLVGIASWIHGDVCADPTYPAVFTAISVHRDWIRNISSV